MNSHEQRIRSFYAAFARRDAAGMAASYHRDVEFSDPVFPALQGDDARDMWTMLCARGKDLQVELGEVRVAGDSGSAEWTARYTFTGTGRRVVNHVRASFEFQDGLIRRHRDMFDLWRWSRLALGPPGLLLGWTPFVKGKVRRQAAKALADFRAKPRS